ncbi:class I lanthipeptide [Flavobacterium sp.]|uniref:class I lanthipeptide n=1 Tax=Flavobacterium sp. TaxID=239 RepID=UPI00286E2FE0|nr:class I lanthipeptide [Flavobacterium sp.]
MKNQNTNFKLAFNKAVIAELNYQKMAEINGGTSDTNGIVDTCTIGLPTLTKQE